MKYVWLKMTIAALVLSSAASLAGEFEPISVGKKLADSNCAWCHGSWGQGHATAPVLAGQWAPYLERQLLGFREHSLDSPSARQYMWGAAERLNPATAHALAVYFSTLTAEPASDGDERLAAAGERIYRDGIPDSNLPSCVPCHGLAAEGLGGIPRLGGQSYNYLKRKLDQWGRGYDAATPPPMPEIAGKFSESEIEALASYLSFIGSRRQATR